MHSKQKGNIGFTATILELQKHGFNVFVESGDNSKIDLIAERAGRICRIQVKYTGTRRGVILKLVKSGPNGYRYTYTTKDVDWFALFDPTTEKIYWVDSITACKNTKTFTLRTTSAKNNQTEKINLAIDFTIGRLLRSLE